MRKNTTKIKCHGCPSALVETAIQAIVILRGKEPTWAEAKSQLGERQQQDEGMNKGREIERRDAGRQSHLVLTERRLGVWQRNTEKMGELKCPKNEGSKS